MRSDTGPDRRERVQVVVPAGFVHHPGCCPDLIKVGEPMARLAALTTLLDRPLLLVGGALLALAAWGVVTFAAVRLAIVSAHRATTNRNTAA